MSKSNVIRRNVFEPRPPILPVGDSDPRTLVPLIGEITTTWEGTEIAYSYFYATILKPTGYTSPAARRAYGSIISANSRKGMIESAAEVFFHLFPSATLEQETTDLLSMYSSAASRRNDIAHGVIMNSKFGSGWYLEANTYSTKRDMAFTSPYAYTSTQIKKIANHINRLRFDVEAFRDTLKEHFQSCDPKLRARY